MKLVDSSYLFIKCLLKKEKKDDVLCFVVALPPKTDIRLHTVVRYMPLKNDNLCAVALTRSRESNRVFENYFCAII